MNIDKNKIIFLLGGHDLEMLTIKEHLLAVGFEQEVNLFDQQLAWGAKLSAYEELLKKHPDKTIYGIELTEDIRPPSNYKRIDHHNDFSDNDASLLQVLQLLNKEPSREDKLVIANDVGHIEAMKCMGASETEIKRIRQEERVIAGVSQEDEAKALEEIASVEVQHGVHIIKTSLNSFSPIVDTYTKRPLLVCSQKSLTYYGDIAFLKEHYKEQIEKNEAYHGRGYFGFDSQYVGSISSNKLVEEILEMSNKNLFSYHQFMFPFRFDKIIEEIKDKHEFYRKYSFDERVKIDEEFKKSLEDDDWKYKKFKVENHLDYNELTYFHDFVKDSLFNTADFEVGATSYFFEKNIADDAKFELKVKGKEVYVLDLKGVALRLFDTGIGILSFEIENSRYLNVDDVLKINDYGRRVYPQFLGDGFSVEPTKDSFLPEYVKVNGIEERFCSLYKEIKLAKYIVDVLGESFSTDKSKKGSHYLQPIIDDRMFVLSWYGNDALVTCTQKTIENKNWYKYIFVDGNDITVQDDEMHKELIKKSTYKRWNNYGTFFGITRYSFVCLSTNSDFTKNTLPLPHMKTMYFQMVTLLLVQRASLLRFSDEITSISDVRGKETPSTENIQSLFKNYLRFVNKLYFKEVTAQDQGIELYDKAIDILNIKRDVEDLRQEIGTLNNYAFLEQDREEKEEMHKLTKLGTLFLPPTLLAGILGMNVFPEKWIDNVWGLGIASLLIGGLMAFSYKKLGVNIKEFLDLKKDDKDKNE